jgi:hypothetical protein
MYARKVSVGVVCKQFQYHVCTKSAVVCIVPQLDFVNAINFLLLTHYLLNFMQRINNHSRSVLYQDLAMFFCSMSHVSK